MVVKMICWWFLALPTRITGQLFDYAVLAFPCWLVRLISSRLLSPPASSVCTCNRNLRSDTLFEILQVTMDSAVLYQRHFSLPDW